MDAVMLTVCLCVIIILALIVVCDGFTIARLRRERDEEKEKSRQDKRDMYTVRMAEAEQSADREEAVRIYAAALTHELKAKQIVNEGLWKKASGDEASRSPSPMTDKRAIGRW